ncbi:MlaD family protein [Pseudorhodoferax sp. Leaf265]|uniref:MlaD family protein n=1 Tax=Pseudorhodoferax sp. Leaf265 TaxID=1736315 RepID=UPI0006FAC705|nr:MlaD family protein [Pseudorhodoferax sp. Leaf265]KQP20445.1 mammalian cell entry protein [Pseudorhodoferax sp. Leaf265]PZQ02770.1 MAG: MCE family protein [Variovorax paradoxus]PZQ16682.1 MAG: MCE family protein [Variovorax paradoxus]
MENKAHAMAAGIFVLVVSALLIALAVWLGRESGSSHTYELSTSDTVTGLQPQAPVRYKGVAVGKVTFIGFDPDVPGNIVIRLTVDDTTPLSPSTFATLSYQGITGLAFVQLDDSGETAQPLPAGASGVPRLPLKNSRLGELTDQAPELLAKVQQALDSVNKMLGEQNQKKVGAVLDNTAVATERIAAVAQNVNQLVVQLDSTLRQRVDPALAQVPGMAQELTRSLQAVRTAADDVARMSTNIDKTADRLNQKDGPLDRLAEGTAALSRVAETFGAATLPRVNRVSEDASRAARQLSRTVNGINDNPQSLIFGSGNVPPGPGEAGFAPPAAAGAR